MSSFIDPKRLKYDIIPKMKKKCMQGRDITYNIAAAAFTKKGNFIDIRYNNHRMFMSNRKGAGLHAEQDLIHLYGNKISKIYILRVGKAGAWLPIHPCKTCMAIAKKRGIQIIPLHEEFHLIKEG